MDILTGNLPKTKFSIAKKFVCKRCKMVFRIFLSSWYYDGEDSWAHLHSNRYVMIQCGKEECRHASSIPVDKHEEKQTT